MRVRCSGVEVHLGRALATITDGNALVHTLLCHEMACDPEA